MLIDTHCHLDAAEFNLDRDFVISKALQQGVSKILIPSVARQNFDAVIALCNQHKNCAYALGVHPMYVDSADVDDIETLKTYIEENNLDQEILEQAEIQVKYSGYIEKERNNADKLTRLEEVKIPEDFDYNKIKSMSIEAKQKLTKIKPATIAQASRISGVSPSDVSV